MNKVTVGNLRGGTVSADKVDANLHAWAHRMIIAGGRYCEECSREKSGPSSSIVIVYNDIHAVLRAAEAVERLGRKFDDQARPRLLPVPVDHLHDPSLFDRLLSDAHAADLIIVSYNGAGDFPAPLKKWIEDCLLQQREGHAAVVALLGSDEQLDPPDSPRYQFFKNAAWAAGLAFIPPLSEAGDAVPEPIVQAKKILS